MAAPEPSVDDRDDRAPPEEVPDVAEVLKSYRRSIVWRSGLPERFARDGTLSFELPPPGEA